jgi:hypothetical protein
MSTGNVPWPSIHCAPDITRSMVYRNVTGCPVADGWLEAAAEVLTRTPPVLFIDVGANKGYAVCAFMQRWTQHKVTEKRWHAGILRFAHARKGKYLKTPKGSCGNCGDCKRAPLRPHGRTGGEAHLLELLPANRELLRAVLAETGLDAVVKVHGVAASK